MGWFNKCDHEFKIISETLTETPLETMHKVRWSPREVNSSCFRRYHILVLQCNICGHVEKQVDELH